MNPRLFSVQGWPYRDALRSKQRSGTWAHQNGRCPWQNHVSRGVINLWPSQPQGVFDACVNTRLSALCVSGWKMLLGGGPKPLSKDVEWSGKKNRIIIHDRAVGKVQTYVEPTYITRVEIYDTTRQDVTWCEFLDEGSGDMAPETSIDLHCHYTPCREKRDIHNNSTWRQEIHGWVWAQFLSIVTAVLRELHDLYLLVGRYRVPGLTYLTEIL
ncbi:hypothetical protein RRG08_029170 [Elysia crispata]|uniref:Uncharacterized protein n=1 Tax=Elysia crispata TaxID=231223 RepID=A0AAE1DZG4_9GAST|nr:hypothetical protein RRG08_029170 [Elysia crispata]